MMKIQVQNKLQNNKVLDSTFNSLATKIFNDNVIKDLKYKIGKKSFQNFNKINDVKEFLLSPEFYKYKFKSVFLKKYISNKNLKLNDIVTDKFNDTDKIIYELIKAECALGKKLSNDTLLNKNENAILNLILSKVFSYTYISKKARGTILKVLDLKVCPYCNMNYIFTFSSGGKRVNLADIDHFFPKSIYPMYSLCLYNFIPACPTCNQKLKSAHNVNVDEYVYPYKEEFGDNCVFDIMNLTECLILNKRPQITLNNKTNDKKIERNVKLFKLRSMYKNFYWLAQKYINISKEYGNIYLDDLLKIDDNFTINILLLLLYDIDFSKEYNLSEISLGKLKLDLYNLLNLGKK